MNTIGRILAVASLALFAGTAGAEGLPKPQVLGASTTRAGTTWLLGTGAPSAADLGRAAALCPACAADEIVLGLLAGDPADGLLPAVDSDGASVLFVEADQRAPEIRLVAAKREAGSAAVTVLEAGPVLDLDAGSRFEGEPGVRPSVAFSIECTSVGPRLHFEVRADLSGAIRYDLFRREPGIDQPWIPIGSVVPTGGLHSNDLLDPADDSANRSRIGPEYRVDVWQQVRRGGTPELDSLRPIKPIWKLVAVATERSDC